MFQIEVGIVAKAEEQEKVKQFSGTKSIWSVWSISCKQGGTGGEVRGNNRQIMKNSHVDLRPELNLKRWAVINA